MKVRILNQCHPRHEGSRLEKLRALYEGGPAWRKLIEQWCPKRYAEPPDVWEERKALATYQNHAGPIIGLWSAMLFGEAPVLDSGEEGKSSALPEWYATWAQDVDGQGNSFSAWWQERLIDALIERTTYVWVNLPARQAEGEAPANRADEEKAGLLDAFLVPLDAQQVLDWGQDDHGALTWLIYRDQVSRRATVDDARTTVWRWTYIDGTVIRRWEWLPRENRTEPMPDDDATELTKITHGVGRLPVLRLGMPSHLWLMGRIEDAVVAASRSRNEHSWALHQAANELLTVTARWDIETKPTLGHGHWLQLNRDKDGEDTAQYVGPSGVAFEHLAKDVEETRQEIYRIVQQMALSVDASATTAKASGESKRMDWQATEVVLGAYATMVRDAMRECLLLVAAARHDTVDESKVQVGGLDGWQQEDLLTFLEAVALAIEVPSMSPTYRKVIAKREARRILGDEVSADDLAKIEEEIDDADVDVVPYVSPASPGKQPPGKTPPAKPGGKGATAGG